jgi:hypothetical protein
VFVPVGIDQGVVCEARDVEAHESAGITSRANNSRPLVSYAASGK